MRRQRRTTADAFRGGCRLTYTMNGVADGPPLLFSNALGTTTGMWTDQLDALAGRFRVVRYDARGHGRSDAPDGKYTLEELGHDALAVLDAAGIERAHVCGVSLGGLTAMWLGIHAPGRVASLVLACTASKIGTADLWNARIEQVRTLGMSSLADSMMPRWFTEEFRRRRPDRVAELRDAFASTSPAGYIGGCAALRDADLGRALGAITAPVLVVSGAFDPATPPSDGRALQKRISGAAFMLLQAAHLANVEQSEGFNESVLHFLTQPPATSNEVP